MTTKIKSGVISDNAITSAHISSGAISSAHLTSIDTDNITEGSSNLYFTTARVDSHLSGGTGVTYSSGAISIGQSVATTDSPTFANLTLTGNLNITGDVDSVSVTDLDVTDKTITVGVGGTASANDGAGLVVDGASASILWDNSNTSWDFNQNLEIASGKNIRVNTINNVGNTANIIYRSSTNTIVGNNATALVIQDGGNVGIGTSSPSSVLEVTGTGDADTGILTTHSRSGVGYTLRLNNTNNGANKGSGIKWSSGGFDTGAIIVRSDAVAASGDAPAYMTFHTSEDGTEDISERMRITSSGNIGIGTDSPTSFLSNATTLEISGDTGVGSELILTNDSSMSADEVVGSLIFKNTDGSGNPNHFAGLRSKAEAQYGRMYLEFYAGRSRMEDGTPDMVISPAGADAQGRVGIGTTSPAQPLHVDLNGTSTSKKYLQLDGNGGSGSVSGQTGIGFRPINAGSNVHASIEGLEDGNGTYKTALTFNINNSNSDTAPVEAMRIDSSRNVGINDTDPSQMLSVSGTSSVVPGRFTAAGNTNTLEVFGNSTTDTSNGLLVSAGTSSNDYAAYFRKVDGTTPIMMVEGTGNIGIGTASPSTDYKLDVGHLNSGAIQARFKSSGDSGYTQGAITIESSVSSDSPGGRGQGVYMFNEANDMTWYAGTLYNSSSTYGIGYKSGTTLQHAAADQGEAGLSLAITTSGKVGIGTSTPSEMLHIVGGGNGPEIRLANSSSSHYIRAYNDNWNFLANASVTAMTIRNDGDVEFGEDVDLTGGRIKVTNSGTDAYFFEGVRSGGNVTLRMYDNSNNLYIDSYTNMSFRCNQTGGGSGGQIYFSGGDVNIGNSSDSARYLIFDKTATGENGIIFRNATANKAKILLDSSEFMQFYINNSTNAMTIRETKGQIDANAVGGRFSGYVQDMIHIGADKSEVVRYGNSGKTYTDGGSSNYAGYVYGQENFLPGVFMPYSPNQVYRLSASIYQLTNGTGYDHSRHYIGVAGYDENFSFLSVDAIGTYQYNMASNTSLSAGNALEVDITIKGWQGSGGSDGNKMDEGTVYIRPLILFNYQRSGGTAVLTGFTMMPAGTISDNDSNAGTNY